jgi:hypothetical protein
LVHLRLPIPLKLVWALICMTARLWNQLLHEVLLSAARLACPTLAASKAYMCADSRGRKHLAAHAPQDVRSSVPAESALQP